jgi:hypothetical protein
MEAALRFVSEQTGLALLLLGVVLVLAAWVPYSLKLKGLTLGNPTQRWSKGVVSILGLALLIVGVYLSYAKANENPIFKPTIDEYLSYISLYGTQKECESGSCRLEYFSSGEFRTPWPTEARYVGRIKTSGRIDKFRSIPPFDVLNPEQYPNNPTYLEFAISPRPGSERALRAQTDLTITKTLLAAQGKVGAHLPYFAKKATMIVDFRTLGFTVTKQLSARLETAGGGGVQRTGLVDPVRWDFAEGKVVSVTATNIPANSSLVLVWGE